MIAKKITNLTDALSAVLYRDGRFRDGPDNAMMESEAKQYAAEYASDILSNPDFREALTMVLGNAYHDLTKAGGPLTPCPHEYGWFVDYDECCDCASIAPAIVARMLEK